MDGGQEEGLAGNEIADLAAKRAVRALADQAAFSEEYLTWQRFAVGTACAVETAQRRSAEAAKAVECEREEDRPRR